MDNETKLLDHGYIKLVDFTGSDELVIESARMSTGKGFLGWWSEYKCAAGHVFEDSDMMLDRCFADGDKQSGIYCCECVPLGKHQFKQADRIRRGDIHLLRTMVNSDPKHTTPFEVCYVTFEVQAPIMVFREWHRHRTQCLAADTQLFFSPPNRHGIWRKSIEDAYKRWQPAKWHRRQTNAFYKRQQLTRMSLRRCDESTMDLSHASIVDVMRGEEKNVIEVEAHGYTVRASEDHKFLTDNGWMRLEDALRANALLAVQRHDRDIKPVVRQDLDLLHEEWRKVPTNEDYEVSTEGRVRHKGADLWYGTYNKALNRNVTHIGTVAELVLLAFVGPKDAGQESRHLNDNPIDDRLCNLAWGWSWQNKQDAKRNGHMHKLTMGFKPIARWKAIGKQQTYDIEVNGPHHNFIANGFVVHNSYNEQSARYVEMPELFYVPSVERLRTGKQSTTNKQGSGGGTFTDEECEQLRANTTLTCKVAWDEYKRQLAQGVAKELARLVLPVNTYSRMRASANLLNWIRFLVLRDHKKAQWEIQQYATVVAKTLRKLFPKSMELWRP